jgi:hypothetical protein
MTTREELIAGSIKPSVGPTPPRPVRCDPKALNARRQSFCTKPQHAVAILEAAARRR